MRRRAPRPRLEMGTTGDGPADTATVVIGIDGSGASWAAFCWACGEARRLGGRAVAVFTSPADGATTAAISAVAGFAAAGCPVADPPVGEQTQSLAADMLREAAGLDLTFVRALGGPVARLLRIAGEVHADLIVVGGSASTPPRLARSVGQRLAARRRESVIVVVPAHCEALNLPGGVSDETSPGGSPRSHRS
jgi:nucleotide-binding universal stress UspA family protein